MHFRHGDSGAAFLAELDEKLLQCMQTFKVQRARTSAGWPAGFALHLTTAKRHCSVLSLLGFYIHPKTARHCVLQCRH